MTYRVNRLLSKVRAKVLFPEFFTPLTRPTNGLGNEKASTELAAEMEDSRASTHVSGRTKGRSCGFNVANGSTFVRRGVRLPRF